MIITDSYFENFQKYILKFKKYEKTHPNISFLWISYLKNNFENYKNVLQEADRALLTLPNFKNDIPLSSILTLQCLFNQQG